MDNRKIEQNAITAVKRAFADVERVLPHIEENDKTECTDGYLQLYSSTSFTVDTVVGQIAVQVKGTSSKRKSERPKRSVRVADLEHYLNIVNGCIYFVVFCGRGSAESEVYYRLLLPYDLKTTLKEVPDGRKNISLCFEKLPTDAQELTRLINRAVKDKIKQQASAGIAFCSMDEYRSAGLLPNKCEFTIDLLDGESPTELAPYKNGVYIYSKDALGQTYPIEKLEDVIGVAAGIERTVSSGDAFFRTIVFIGEDENGEHTAFRGFDLRHNTNQLTLNETGSLKERIEDLSLMKAMAETGSLTIDGHNYAYGIRAKGETLESLSTRLETLSLISETLDSLHFKPGIDVDELTEQDLRNLAAVHRGLVEGELLHYENHENGFARFVLCGYTVKLLLHERNPKQFRMIDALSLDDCTVAVYVYADAEDEREIVAPLFVLTADEYRIVANIDAEVFAESLDKYPINERSSFYINGKMLEMLLAYDEGACCGDELLECCGITVEALTSFTDEATTLINRCQIAARRRELTDEERRALASVEADSASLQARACAAALRGDAEMAWIFVNMLSNDDRAAFETWPIMRFLR